MKRAFFYLCTVVFMTLALSPLSHAAATTTANAQMPSEGACGITQGDISAIKTIQNNMLLDYSDELQQELAARRDLLSKTIECAEAEAEQAKTDLAGATIDPNLENLKNQWLGHFDDAISYYNLQLQKVGEVGISGTESIAKEVLVWREDNYTPLAENVLNFVMWSNGQVLFSTAQNRLAQIGNLADSPLFSESTDIQNDYEEAAASLKSANDQNNAAENAFAQSLPPDQSLVFIQQSLDSLSSTYQYFFDISGLVQSLLPH
jgi:hypothetical protein